MVFIIRKLIIQADKKSTPKNPFDGEANSFLTVSFFYQSSLCCWSSSYILSPHVNLTLALK